MKALLLTLSCLLMLPCWADQIYRHVDEEGNVKFSDSPPSEQAEKVQLKTTNTVPPIEITEEEEKPTATPEALAEPEGPPPYNLRIAQPKDEYQVGPAEQILSVLLLTDRNLDDNHYFSLSIDGEAYGEASKSNNININVRRSLQGRRLITASIVDDDGVVIDSTPAITIYVIRPPVRPKPAPR